QLGCSVDETSFTVQPATGRKLVFVGDLVDRGPKIPQVLKLVMNAVASDAALCLPGNHDVKLMRKLKGRDVQVTHGLAESLAQLERETPDFRAEVADFVDRLVSHYVLDDGNLVVAHAGMRAEMQGRGSGRVRGAGRGARAARRSAPLGGRARQAGRRDTPDRAGRDPRGERDPRL